MRNNHKCKVHTGRYDTLLELVDNYINKQQYSTRKISENILQSLQLVTNTFGGTQKTSETPFFNICHKVAI